MTPKAPSGRRIWDAVRDELRLNLYPLPFSTVAPTVYHVYLHPDDFASIEGIAPKLADQLRQALTTEVERLNRSRSRRVRALAARLLDREQEPVIEVPPDGWEVHVRPDANGELTRGQLGIVSTLALPAPAEYDGTPTTRIVRSVVGAQGRSTMVNDVPRVQTPPAPGQAPAQIPAFAVPAAGPVSSAERTGRVNEANSGRERARLRYTDEQGAHEFVMRKEAISIGRGGSAAWVDVQVMTRSRVSREHARIRVGEDGVFRIHDVSLWGTTVDEVAIPPAVKGPEGVVSPGAEHVLPARARIGLAGVLEIDFEVL